MGGADFYPYVGRSADSPDSLCCETYADDPQLRWMGHPENREYSLGSILRPIMILLHGKGNTYLDSILHTLFSGQPKPYFWQPNLSFIMMNPGAMLIRTIPFTVMFDSPTAEIDKRRLSFPELSFIVAETKKEIHKTGDG